MRITSMPMQYCRVRVNTCYFMSYMYHSVVFYHGIRVINTVEFSTPCSSFFLVNITLTLINVIIKNMLLLILSIHK